MRSLLSIATIALALGFCGAGLSAAPMGGVGTFSSGEWETVPLTAAPAANGRFALSMDSSRAFIAQQSKKSQEMSFVAAAGTIVVLAGAGLIGTLAAVGLKRVWIDGPIGPCNEGPF